MAVPKLVQDKLVFLETLFKPLRDQSLILTFGQHMFKGMRLSSIEYQQATGFKLAPDKRKDANGKNKTPTLIRVTFEGDNKIVLADEDTTWTAIRNGVRAKLGDTVIEIRKEG